MRTIKTGIVGIGRIADAHINELSALPGKFQIIAVADNDPERLANLPEKVKDVLKYPSLEKMLGNPDIEMVTICTRHPDHVPMALKIMDAGKSRSWKNRLRLALRKWSFCEKRRKSIRANSFSVTTAVSNPHSGKRNSFWIPV